MFHALVMSFLSTTLKDNLCEEQPVLGQVLGMCHEVSAYVLATGSSPVTRHTVHIYQDVSARRPGFRAGVMIPIDFWSSQFGS